jgi:cobalt/nickel transport system permease protein
MHHSRLYDIITNSLTPNIFHQGTHPGRRASGFGERTLLGIVGLIKSAVENESIAARQGLLQRLDPRLKLLSMVILLAAVLFSRNIAAIAALYACALVLAAVSSISPLFFLKRTLLFVPIFAAAVAVPALFRSVTPGDPLFSFMLFGHSLSITKPGAATAALFVMRVLASVSLAALLVLTTRQQVLLKTLRIFRIPALFVMVAGMCYRYIFLFLDIIQNAFTAVRSRVGFVSSSKTGRRIATVNMAGLWLRSYRMQTQVYSAMIARGYTGEPQVYGEFRIKPRDGVALTLSLLLFLGILWLNRYSH